MDSESEVDYVATIPRFRASLSTEHRGLCSFETEDLILARDVLYLWNFAKNLGIDQYLALQHSSRFGRDLYSCEIAQLIKGYQRVGLAALKLADEMGVEFDKAKAREKALEEEKTKIKKGKK